MSKQQIRAALLHALTQYDRRQSKKPSWNRYALPQYLARLDEIMGDIERGATPRAAIVAGLSGGLANACLRAIKEAPAQKGEEWSAWFYIPATIAPWSPDPDELAEQQFQVDQDESGRAQVIVTAACGHSAPPDEIDERGNCVNCVEVVAQ